MAWVKNGGGKVPDSRFIEQIALDRGLANAVVADRIARMLLRSGNFNGGTVYPYGAAMQELLDAPTQCFYQLNGAFNRVRGQIDDAIRFEIANPGAEAAGGLFRPTVDRHPFDASPCAMVDIRLPLPTAHTQHRVAGFNQT